ncbi:MAG: hypothetical protein ACJA1B_000481, partial [Polaribacter sp.]
GVSITAGDLIMDGAIIDGALEEDS